LPLKILFQNIKSDFISVTKFIDEKRINGLLTVNKFFI